MHKISLRLSLIGALSLTILAGFALRSYNINFPSIGYHNMKENECLSQAQEMIRTGDYMTKRVYFHNAFEDGGELEASAGIPMVAYQTIISWKLFGENLRSARLCGILFGLLSILMVYLIARKLSIDISSSLFACILFSIMPIAVFFSRNIQPESPALFFMLLGSLLYLRRNLFLGGLSFLTSWIYDPNFIIGIFPFLFCIQLKDAPKTGRDFLKLAFAAVTPYFVMLAAFLWVRHGSAQEINPFAGSNFLYIFNPGYWKKYGVAIWRYVALENFTFVFTLTTFLGILFAIFKKKTLLGRYIIGWAFAGIPYGMFYSDALRQAGFYYMPFLALVCISSAYAVSQISEAVKKIIKKDSAIGIIVITIVISMPFIYNSLKSMHATVFLGLDVAGESLKELTKPDQRVFLFTHSQGNAIARYARRYMGWPEDPGNFKETERRFKVSYLCIYPVEFMHILETGNPALYSYIQEHYHVKEAGLTQDPYQLFYLILEKGKGVDLKKFLKEFSGPTRLRTIYKLFGKPIFFYTLRPGAE